MQAPGLLCTLPPALLCTLLSRVQAELRACGKASRPHAKVDGWMDGVPIKPQGCRLTATPGLQALALRTTQSNSSSQRPLHSATFLFRFRSQESGANDMGWQLHIWEGSELVTHFCWAQISESFWNSAKSTWQPLSTPQCSQGCVTRGARE